MFTLDKMKITEETENDFNIHILDTFRDEKWKSINKKKIIKKVETK